MKMLREILRSFRHGLLLEKFITCPECAGDPKKYPVCSNVWTTAEEGIIGCKGGTIKEDFVFSNATLWLRKIIRSTQLKLGFQFIG
jgi:hypothetical protein